MIHNLAHYVNETWRELLDNARAGMGGASAYSNPFSPCGMPEGQTERRQFALRPKEPQAPNFPKFARLRAPKSPKKPKLRSALFEMGSSLVENPPPFRISPSLERFSLAQLSGLGRDIPE
jgi:hypothetical protein